MFLSNSFSTIDEVIVQWFNNLGAGGNILLIFLSLISACLMSGIIGFEREYHGHAAGLRTHMLVAVGSALVMIVSIYGFGSGYPNRDPARLAAQVVSGIGFLGAGTIIQTGIDVKGLTTATTLWLTMAIGLACGAGQFVVAALATFIAFVTLMLLRKVESWANNRNPKIIFVVSADSAVLKQATLLANKYGIKIKDFKTEVVLYKGSEAFRVSITTSYISRAMISAFGDDLRETLKPYEIKF